MDGNHIETWTERAMLYRSFSVIVTLNTYLKSAAASDLPGIEIVREITDETKSELFAWLESQEWKEAKIATTYQTKTVYPDPQEAHHEKD